MWLIKIAVFGLASFFFVHLSWKGHEGSRGFQKNLLSPDKKSLRSILSCLSSAVPRRCIIAGKNQVEMLPILLRNCSALLAEC